MEDLKKRIDCIEKERQKEIKDLESRSKKLYELIASENFTVNAVIAESYATTYTPHSEIVFGGKSPVYHGGLTSRLILTVTPDNENTPVRKLTFDGISAVRGGDRISAKMPKYEEKFVGPSISMLLQRNAHNIHRAFYLDRSFNTEESAIELAILSDDRKILRTDRAVDYKDFIKE